MVKSISMDSKDIRDIISNGEKSGKSPYQALLEAGIIKPPDKNFLVNNYDFNSHKE